MLAFGAPAAASPSLPPQGLYENCAPASAASRCAAHLQTMSQAGFQLVLNYQAWAASPQQLLDYADTAASLGLKVIWPLDDPAWRNGDGTLAGAYPALGAACSCSDDDAFLAYAVSLVKDLPATWGYYVGDEVPADQLSQVQGLTAKLKALDPAHPQLLIADGTSLNPAQNLAPFGGVADVVGSDVYPVGWPVSATDVVGSVAAVDQQIAASHHAQAAVALQAFSWSQDPSASTATAPRWPTEQEMQAMRDAALAHSDPALMLWFSYPEIASSDDPPGHWQDLVNAAFADLPAPGSAAAQAPSSSGLPAASLPETAAPARMRALSAGPALRQGRRHERRRHRRR